MTNDDLISRQDAIDIANELRACMSVETYWAWVFGLRKLSSTQPEQKHGRWEKRYISDYRFQYYCSECGMIQVYGEPNYCPNCGAEMRGESHD